MQINKNLLIELLQNEVIKVRKFVVDDTKHKKQHRSRIENLKKRVEDLQADMAADFVVMKKDTEDLQADFAEEHTKLIKNHGIEFEKLKNERSETVNSSFGAKTKNDAKLEEVIKQLKLDAKRKDEFTEERVKEFHEGIREDKKIKYDLSQKIAALEKENTELLKMLGDARAEKPVKPVKAVKAETAMIQKDKKEVTGNELKDQAMMAIKNKLHIKNYVVTTDGKSIIAKKQGTRQIEVQPAELPGSLKYIICGQTYYQFDQALKASVYGFKAIDLKNQAEALV